MIRAQSKPRTRVKRRSGANTVACSKEDEEILKAVYEKNPKPDKATRMELVSKVALGEKEVQVRRIPEVPSHMASRPLGARNE